MSIVETPQPEQYCQLSNDRSFLFTMNLSVSSSRYRLVRKQTATNQLKRPLFSSAILFLKLFH